MYKVELSDGQIALALAVVLKIEEREPLDRKGTAPARQNGKGDVQSDTQTRDHGRCQKKAWIAPVSKSELHLCYGSRSLQVRPARHRLTNSQENAFFSGVALWAVLDFCNVIFLNAPVFQIV